MRSYQTSDGRNGQRMSGSNSRRQNYDRAGNNSAHGNRSKPPPREPQPIRRPERGAQPTRQPEREPQPIRKPEREPQRGSGIFENLTSNPSGLIKTVLNFIPPGIYDRETKKLFGIFTAEDLFLAALILMLADSDDNDDTALLIALVYILLG